MVESLAVSSTSETLPATERDMSNTKPPTMITSTIKPPSKRIISALIWAFSSINIDSTFSLIDYPLLAIFVLTSSISSSELYTEF